MKHYVVELNFMETGYVYFIQMDRIGPIKIGFTKNIGKRLVSLQVSSPYPLRVLCIIPGTEETEKELHRCYHDVRMEGEWFLPHPIILRDIEDLLANNRRNGFREPIPEYDLQWGQKFEDFFSHIDGMIFDWKGFHLSEDFQDFKQEPDKEKRDRILDKYIRGKYPE